MREYSYRSSRRFLPFALCLTGLIALRAITHSPKLHFGEYVSNLAEVLALSCNSRCVAFVGKYAYALQDGGVAFVVGEPPADAALVAEQLGHARSHCQGKDVPDHNKRSELRFWFRHYREKLKFGFTG